MTMKNKKLLKYFTEQILPILDEIEFDDTEQESEGMNVQQLIDELQKIADKSRGVILSQGGMAVGGIRFNQSNIEFVSEARRTVWLSNADGTVEKYVEKYGDAL